MCRQGPGCGSGAVSPRVGPEGRFNGADSGGREVDERQHAGEPRVDGAAIAHPRAVALPLADNALLVEVLAVADRAEQGVLDILVIDERAGRERDQDLGLVEPTVVAGLPLELAPQGPEIVDEAGASKRVAITRWCGKWWPSS